MLSKQKYIKINMWKKKPIYENIIGGFAFVILSLLMLTFFVFQYDAPVLLTILFTSMLVFGSNLVNKSWGEGKITHYVRK